MARPPRIPAPAFWEKKHQVPHLASMNKTGVFLLSLSLWGCQVDDPNRESSDSTPLPANSKKQIAVEDKNAGFEKAQRIVKLAQSIKLEAQGLNCDQAEKNADKAISFGSAVSADSSIESVKPMLEMALIFLANADNELNYCKD